MFSFLKRLLMDNGKTKTALFIDLAGPDDTTGISRWVSATEFVGEYKDLALGNGGSWCRKESTLARQYVVEFDKTLTPGNSIDRIRLNGFNTETTASQTIRAEIRDEIRKHRCVVLGTSLVEVDHKNGRKDDPRVWDPKTQLLSDFQPLSKAANDAKRQFCKECKSSEKRYDATRLGYPMAVFTGDLDFHPELGCTGCFWHDPMQFREHLEEKHSEFIK
jgi:hypothetical protein